MTPPSLSPQQQTFLQQALALHRGGQVGSAKDIYLRLLQEIPRHPDVLRLLGTAESQLGNLEEGVRLIGESLKIAPNQPEAYHNQANILQSLKRFAEAVAGYDKALALQPNFPDAWFSRGNALRSLGQIGDAAASYQRALALRSDYADAWLNLGAVLLDAGQIDAALASFDKALVADPNHLEAMVNQGNALRRLGRFEQALASYDRRLQLGVGSAEFHCNRAHTLKNLNRLADAVAAYDQALAVNPGLTEAWINRGDALQALDQFEEAIASYDRALAIQSDVAEGLQNRGTAFQRLKRFDEALVSLDAALTLRPDLREAYHNRGLVLQSLERWEDALVDYDRALAIDPDNSETHHNRAAVLQALKRNDEALVSYDRALALAPDLAEALGNRANVKLNLGGLEEALVDYDKALALKPDYEWLPGITAHLRMHVADWAGIAERVEGLSAGITRGEKMSTPFPLQGLVDSPKVQLENTILYASAQFASAGKLPEIVLPARHDRIRIGYFSSDFGNHPVSHLLAGMFQHHDRERFEIFGFSLRERSEDPWRDRVMQAVDRFIDVSGQSDRDITALARQLEIDIAVDLNGWTSGGRPAIFAERAAPVQASYIGYLGTMGASYFDYLLADEVLIPADKQAFYAERIAYLPSYQTNDKAQAASSRSFTRAELGLPESGVVFCSFNQMYKITPDVFASWMRILDRVPGSVLWLSSGNPTARSHLKGEAGRRGVDPTRLIFGETMPLADHLARQPLADLFLDNHPYNAGATASNALRMGVPVVTRLGESFAARMGASLLRAVGLPELIATTVEAYEDLAVSLASDRERLRDIRRRLTDSIATSRLFDTEQSTRDIERLYAQMYARSREGLLPVHLHV